VNDFPVLKQITQVRKKQSLRVNLMSEYGSDIHGHLKQLESCTKQQGFLLKHQILPDFRAKMVDWMVEVLTTFKNSDQTYFLAINLLDRYFKQTDKVLNKADLHLTGVCTMYIASKYEDVIPLLMTTVVNKIGHNKFEVPTIEDKELDILKTIAFRVGAPTLKEFLDRYVEEINEKELKNKKFKRLCMYLAKLTCYDYSLS
jgi:hypothetical protein